MARIDLNLTKQVPVSLQQLTDYVNGPGQAMKGQPQVEGSDTMTLTELSVANNVITMEFSFSGGRDIKLGFKTIKLQGTGTGQARITMTALGTRTTRLDIQGAADVPQLPSGRAIEAVVRSMALREVEKAINDLVAEIEGTTGGMGGLAA